MPKAVLVTDMPECCADCPCSFFERDNPILNLICGVAQEDAYNVGKPDWCPLRELPKHKRTIGTVDEGKKLLLNAGWNDCLDEILKRRKE